MLFPDITAYLQKHFAVETNEQAPQPYLPIAANKLDAICQFLRDDEQLFFDLLACLTAIDNGPTVGTIDVVYSLTSIPYGHNLMLRVTVPRNADSEPLPSLPSVSHIWRTADWHEREAFDLVGIQFTGHPDLRRILLPADWVGYPLRQDYQEATSYHGIQTK